MKYKVVLHQSEEGFSVWVPRLPGCVSQGETEEEALINIADAIHEYLEVVFVGSPLLMLSSIYTSGD